MSSFQIHPMADKTINPPVPEAEANLMCEYIDRSVIREVRAEMKRQMRLEKFLSIPEPPGPSDTKTTPSGQQDSNPLQPQSLAASFHERVPEIAAGLGLILLALIFLRSFIQSARQAQGVGND